MKKIFFHTLLLGLIAFSIACNDDDNEQMEPEAGEVAITVNNSVIQKGPFSQGSTVDIQELDDELVPTGRIFSTQTNNDFGSFDLNATLNSNKVDISATGFYFNEVEGELSQAQLTLRTYVEYSDTNEKLNINILTTLARQRIKYLILEEELTYENAKSQAEGELLSAFSIPESLKSQVTEFEEMDISQSSVSNAILLAVSVVVQADNSVGQLSELITKLADDLEEDGTIDDPSLISELRNNSANIDFESVKENLFERFSDLGVDFTIPEFEDYVDTDGDGTINLNDVAPIAPIGIISNSKPVFEWKASNIENTKYRFQLSLSENFDELLIDAPDLEEARYELDETLTNDTDYHWRINYLDEAGEESDWNSVAFRFELMSIDLIFPVEETELINLEQFNWQEIDMEGTTYDFQIASDEDFENILFELENLEAAETDLPAITFENTTQYHWRVRGADANEAKGNWKQSVFRFNVPAAINLTPGDNQTIDQLMAFSWSSSIETDIFYEFQLSKQADFSDNLINETGLPSTEFIPENLVLENQTNYFWRVRTSNLNGVQSEWSETAEFTFELMNVSLSFPVTEINLVNLDAFSWEAIDLENVTYDFQIATDETFTELLTDLEALTVTTLSVPDIALENETIYHWRVRATDENGVKSSWSETVFGFNLAGITLERPFDNFTISELTEFIWMAAANPAVTYTLQVSDTEDFSNIVVEQNNLTAISYPPNEEDFTNGTMYFWRVRYVNSLGMTSDWSEVSRFTFDIGQPAIGGPTGQFNISAVSEFVWMTIGVQGATYDFQLSTDPDFSNLVFSQTGIESSTDTEVFFPAIDIPFTDKTLYYWRVRGVTPSGIQGTWAAESFRYEIEVFLEGQPTEDIFSSPDLSWTTSSTLELTYELQIASDDAFEQLLYENAMIIETSVDNPINLTALGTYHWRVRATNVNNVSTDWFTFSFEKIIPQSFFYADVSRMDGLAIFRLADATFDDNPQAYIEEFTLDVEISDNNDFTNNVREFKNLPLTERVEFEIWDGPTDGYGTYYIRARYVNSQTQEGEWYETSFTITEPDINIEFFDPTGLLPLIGWSLVDEFNAGFSLTFSLSEDSDFNTVLETGTISNDESFYRVQSVLVNDAVYYVQVVLKDESGNEFLTKTEIFRAEPGVVFLTGFDDLREEFTFSFNNRRNDVELKYEFQITDTEEFFFDQPLETITEEITLGESSPYIDQKVVFKSGLTFQEGTNYRFRIRLIEFDEPGEWSAVDSFSY